MKIVAVKHSADGKKYWFGVPNELANRVKPGVTVVCCTNNGLNKGIVVSNIYSDRAYKPTHSILDVLDKKQVKTSDIIVSKNFLRTRPNKNKLIARINEFYSSGRFDTEIMVDDDNVLYDGYTAWMVAKMLGVEYLTVNA